MGCDYCEIIEQKRGILYEDEEVVIAVRDMVVIPGQVTIFTKHHHTILEMVPNDLLRKCSQISSKVTMAVFEGLDCQGTNLIVRNGLGAGQVVPHFGIDIIPRRENDGLNLQWKSQELMEDEMERTFLMLNEDITEGNIKRDVKNEATKKIADEEGKDNYLLKSLRKIP